MLEHIRQRRGGRNSKMYKLVPELDWNKTAGVVLQLWWIMDYFLAPLFTTDIPMNVC